MIVIIYQLIQDRVKILISTLGLNPSSFAKKIGVQGAIIHNIVSDSGRRNKPSFDLLNKILLSFNNINSHWIMTGEGDIFIQSETKYPENNLVTQLQESKESYQSQDILGIISELERNGADTKLISSLRNKVARLYKENSDYKSQILELLGASEKLNKTK